MIYQCSSDRNAKLKLGTEDHIQEWHKTKGTSYSTVMVMPMKHLTPKTSEKVMGQTKATIPKCILKWSEFQLQLTFQTTKTETETKLATQGPHSMQEDCNLVF